VDIVPPLMTFLVCYIIGSFPTAYLVGRLNRINIFEVGSGNMGANNVVRSLGVKWGALVWMIDSGKGILAVLLAPLLMPQAPASARVIGAIAVVVGHNWSLIATLVTGTLRGGKGAATAGGTWIIMMAPWWYIVVITLTLWGLLVLLTRYVSLAVLVSVAIGSVWVLILISQGSDVPPLYMFYIVLVGLMIYVRHWKNIQALLAGRERRLGDPAK
jgi:acyl phosphate:glycerol-3-phosphate acyltransferase